LTIIFNKFLFKQQFINLLSKQSYSTSSCSGRKGAINRKKKKIGKEGRGVLSGGKWRVMEGNEIYL
jgi:tRNA(Phe) wybutosine-synthesizing methylase Tyw3